MKKCCPRCNVVHPGRYKTEYCRVCDAFLEELKERFNALRNNGRAAKLFRKTLRMNGKQATAKALKIDVPLLEHYIYMGGLSKQLTKALYKLRQSPTGGLRWK